MFDKKGYDPDFYGQKAFLLSDIYSIPFLTFRQGKTYMTVQAKEQTEGIAGDICLAWISFHKDDHWQEPILVVWSQYRSSVVVEPRHSINNPEEYDWYRLYPEEVHSSILRIIERSRVS